MSISAFNAIKNPALEQLTNTTTPSGIVGAKGAKGSEDFATTLMDVLKEVNGAQQNAAAKQNAFMTGQQVDYHDLMISVEKASISLQLTMAVRNKILDAYSEISHMQI